MNKLSLAAGAAAISPLGLALAVALAGGATISSTTTAAAAVAYACGGTTASVGTSTGNGQTLTAEQMEIGRAHV